MGRRRKAREIVLQALYAQAINSESVEAVVDDQLSKSDYDEEVRGYVRRLACKVDEEKEELDKIIAERATNWEIGRIALIDKLILRMGLCELLYFPDIPCKVCINESIEITKKYSSADAKRFVNGILDSVYKERVQGEE
ncbi:MAG: transcription antitermination factor NusB [Candidatus Latescibacteria bacterium]|nr:transcription antitermination factor NusB [Candidatus Latescibacterota bacterium]